MIAVDSSGNGNDGEYDSVDGPRFVAGCVAGDRALDAAGTSPGTGARVDLPLAPTQWLDDWTVEAWIRGTDATVFGTVTGDVYFASGPDLDFGAGAGLSESIYVHLFGSTRLQDGRAGTMWAVAEGVPNDGDPHHLVVTYANPIETDGSGTPTPGSHLLEADVTIYIDAVAMTLTETGVLTKPEPDEGKVDASIGAFLDGVLDEFAVYPGALSSGDVSAHYAAATVSFAAYTAAVLADGPTVYYHLNDGSQGWHVGFVGMGA